ncbi:3-phosphoinositide-dependent kinase 1 [Micractinium conductrix]|uniref:non-specific serine/threonine protein kinase n=1 Tax=Micractinium conductrix TaxID=554055 RepID=A0A2P6VI76_9CHLO|nr:3-phosphoinositide-dependent kinase 1 [Micractinium conductrix]|eukprot:PSC73799.1 3-phosphoinositide-dependent kinase 1 [Micractinium conductrix]
MCGAGEPASEAEPKAPRMQVALADFELLRRIGDGSYSHVVLARHRSTGREYALKVIDKAYILRHKVVDYIRKERVLLDALDHPGIARLFFTFQDAYSLYLGLEHCPNGELYDQIRLRGCLDADAARFYTAQIPENLLLDAEGHLKLIDFGSAKQLAAEGVVPPAAAAPAAAAAAAITDSKADGSGSGAEGGAAAAPPSGGGSGAAEAGEQQAAGGSSGGGEQAGAGEQAEAEAAAEEAAAASPEEGSKRMVSLVGTADYVSPEILNNRPVTCAADLWALGCVLYQMLVGRPPFKTPSEYLTFQKILEADYEMPEDLPAAAADLIRRLLVLEPSERIGSADLSELRAHPFFEGVDWAAPRSAEPPEFLLDPMDAALSSADSSFDWELQSLASALPRTHDGDELGLE